MTNVLGLGCVWPEAALARRRRGAGQAPTQDGTDIHPTLPLAPCRGPFRTGSNCLHLSPRRCR